MSKTRIIVCTAYTTNYVLGRLCEDVNRRYCERHGYEFVTEVLTPQDMQAITSFRIVYEYIHTRAEGGGGQRE